jgi:hypothetical protein
MERFGPVEKVFRPSWCVLFVALYLSGFFAVTGAAFLWLGVQGAEWFGSCGLVMCPPSLFLIVATIRSRHRRITLHRDGIVVKDPLSPALSKQYGDRPAVVAPGINGLLWADMQDAIAWQYRGSELPFRLKLSGPPGAVCLELSFYSQSTLLAKTLLDIIEERHVPLRIEWDMKLSVAEIVILAVGINVVLPVLAAVLTPSVDVISMCVMWLGLGVVFLVGFFLIRLIPYFIQRS